MTLTTSIQTPCLRLLPTRCITCGKAIGHLFYIMKWNADEFRENNITRICCQKTLKYIVDPFQYTDNYYRNVTSSSEGIEIRSSIEKTCMVIPR